MRMPASENKAFTASLTSQSQETKLPDEDAMSITMRRISVTFVEHKTCGHEVNPVHIDLCLPI